MEGEGELEGEGEGKGEGEGIVLARWNYFGVLLLLNPRTISFCGELLL